MDARSRLPHYSAGPMDNSEPNEASLFDRVGGEPGIERLVDAFYVAVLADPELAPFFREVEMAKLHRMQHEFFSAALGGPITYTGRPVGHVHHGRGIKPAHLRAFVGHLLSTLDGFEITEEERDEIVDRINRYSDEVLGTSGGVDG